MLMLTNEYISEQFYFCKEARGSQVDEVIEITFPFISKTKANTYGKVKPRDMEIQT